MSRCLVIMQPTFIPWAGYFNLIQQAEDFIFLDDVQLEKQSWQTRNRLIISGQSTWISLQIKHEALEQRILDTELLNRAHWCKKLERSFIHSYSKHPYFSDAFDVLKIIIDPSLTNLTSLNVSVIRFIISNLGLSTKIHRTSELDIQGIRTERLASLCDQFKAKEYLSPKGAAEYLLADGFQNITKTQLRFQDFQPQPYQQIGTRDFVSHLSILDVIANLGWERTKLYICKGEA